VRAEVIVPAKCLSIDMLDWLYDKLGSSSWEWSRIVDSNDCATFWFNRDEDAVMFSLRWL
jgi:hypothetical protein